MSSLELPLLTELIVLDCPSLMCCSSLSNLTNIFIGCCPELESLDGDFAELTRLTLPSSLSVFRIEGFQNLRIICCASLPELYDICVKCCPKLESLDGDFTKLSSMILENCPLFSFFPDGALTRKLRYLSIEETSLDKPIQEWVLTSLEYLRLENVGNFTDSVECIKDLLPRFLYYFNIKGFQNLRIICCSSLPNLNDICVSNCPKLESLDVDFTELNFMEIGNCPLFRFFPDGGLPRKLVGLSIYETSIDKSIQEWGLHLLTSLEYLMLENVRSCSDSVGCISNLLLPSSLSELEIGGFQNLNSISCSTLPNLTHIWIRSCPKLESFGDNGLPQHVSYVYIEDCGLIEEHLKSNFHGRINTENGTYSLC